MSGLLPQDHMHTAAMLIMLTCVWKPCDIRKETRTCLLAGVEYAQGTAQRWNTLPRYAHNHNGRRHKLRADNMPSHRYEIGNVSRRQLNKQLHEQMQTLTPCLTPHCTAPTPNKFAMSPSPTCCSGCKHRRYAACAIDSRP